jgi:DNA-binding transcriptional LysR family regulator
MFNHRVAITLTQLRAFLTVTRTGSVQAAASQLVVSQPSVSAAIAALARELGVDLLERQGRGVRLTEAGEAFAPYAAEVLGLLEQGADAAREASEPERSRIRLVCVNTAGEYLVPPLLQAFRQLHPRMHVLLEVGNRSTVMARLASRQADIGIGGRPPGHEIDGFPFLDNELIVVGREVPPDLARTPWLLREEGSGTRALTEQLLAQLELDEPELLTLGSIGAIKQTLAIGLGVTLISSHAVAHELREGSLVVIPVPGTPLGRAWHVLLPAGTLPRPAVRTLAAFLRSDDARAAIANTL